MIDPEFASTPARAYKYILENGLLSERRMQVYAYVFKNQDKPHLHGGPSRANVKAHFHDVTDSYVPRIAELIHMGMLIYAGEKINDEDATGMEVSYLRTTNRQRPLPLPKKPKFFLLMRLVAGKVVALIRGSAKAADVMDAAQKRINDGTASDELHIAVVQKDGKVELQPYEEGKMELWRK